MLPQSGLLSDQLVTSPILNGDGGSGPSGMGDTSEGRYGREFKFGIDPSVDPELALALRMSIEEEKLRLEKQNKERAEAGAEATLPEIGEEDEKSQPQLNKEAEAGGSRDSCSR
jgi:26S proteasome regulatory subunit N10